MRLLVLSDLHTEFAPFAPPFVDVDAVVLAGDICAGRRGAEWIRRALPPVPVVYVLGNHEFYGQTMPNLIEHVRAKAAGSNIRLLENERLDLGDVVFLGATLWTDFMLLGASEAGRAEAESQMTDYRRIRILPHYRRLRAHDTARIHAESLRWLRDQFANQRGRRVVVVTHHAPSALSLPAEQRSEATSVAYASELDSFVAASGAALWIHGHVHVPCDYVIGQTRVLANPRGYPDEAHPGFRPALIVEV